MDPTHTQALLRWRWESAGRHGERVARVDGMSPTKLLLKLLAARNAPSRRLGAFSAASGITSGRLGIFGRHAFVCI